ncbi:MAG: cupin domain-containing protein [Chloroflexi bacterium]|nr:cupin domain-containing protein [Chloroflexota bacterium]
MQTRISHNAATPVEMMPGLVRRTLAWGEKAMVCEFSADTGVFIPLHDHPHEQVGYVIAGQVEFVSADETFIAEPGDSYAIPGGVKHSARFLAPTTLIEVFSPVREEFK